MRLIPIRHGETEWNLIGREMGHLDSPGGETVRERTDRSVRILTAIAEEHPDQTVVAVTHSGFLMGFVEHVLGLGPGNGWRFERQNASYNAFLYERGVWRLETWNDTAHLT